MGKYSEFDRRANDTYDTPFKGVLPLLPFLEKKSFCEPCAGKGDLVNHLIAQGMSCEWFSDLEPRANHIPKLNAFDITWSPTQIITNPPWTRSILHPMIEHFSSRCDTWLLFDADWMHTTQKGVTNRLMRNCHKIVSVGRLKWIEGSKNTGKENCAWYLFRPTPNQDAPLFYDRI